MDKTLFSLLHRLHLKGFLTFLEEKMLLDDDLSINQDVLIQALEMELSYRQSRSFIVI